MSPSARAATSASTISMCGLLAAKGGDEERRTAAGILDIRLFAVGDQLLDRGDIAIGGRCMQPGIYPQITLARRRLRHKGGCWRDGEQCQRRCNRQHCKPA